MSDTQLPPMSWIAATLRTTTETLMRELASPSAAAPAWDRNEWRVAEAVAAIQGISPLLASVLRWRGPQHWNDFLDAQREHTCRRHERIVELLSRLDRGARHAGFGVAALKGAALHEAGVYRCDERPMSDVDLLVHPHDREAAIRMIESLDYVFSYETTKHIVYEPRVGRAAAQIGEHADNPIKIELHTSIAEQIPLERCDISELILPQRELVGLQYYRTTSALMAHVLLHAAGALALHGIRALNLLDIARLAARMHADDWREVLALQGEGRFWWAFPVVVLVERYFAGSIPAFALDAARRSCAWPLRSICVRRELADVSLSDARIHAFPGIEWSRTAGEAARFMYARLCPDASVRSIRRSYGKYQSLGVDAPWVRQSQLQRILHWLIGQRTRVDTMASVRAALSTEGRRSRIGDSG